MATAKVAWPITIVQYENGIPPIEIAERSAIPVMTPGRAIGSTMNSDPASRPKKRRRHTAAAAIVPRMRAMAVAIAATRSDRERAARTSPLFQATPNQPKVSPGGGDLNE